jgi:hypothetical protein
MAAKKQKAKGKKPKPFTPEFFREKGREGGQKRFASMSEAELKKHQRNAAKKKAEKQSGQ